MTEIMQPVSLHIRRNALGQVTVEGPLDNPLFCYGLLEIAKDVIRDHNASRLRTTPKEEIPAPPANGEAGHA